MSTFYWDESLMQNDNKTPSILAFGDSWFWYLFPGGSLINNLGPMVGNKSHIILAKGGNGAEADQFVNGKYANAHSGKILFSSGGAGSNNHMTAAQFRFNAGIRAVHVGFKSGSEALVEVLAGRAHYCMAGMSVALPFIKDRRLHALGVTTPRRSPLLPDVPAIAEVVPGFTRDAAFGLYAPAGTPGPIRRQISQEIARILDLPDIKERLQGMGFAAVSSTPEELDKILREQIEMFSIVAKNVGLRAN